MSLKSSKSLDISLMRRRSPNSYKNSFTTDTMSSLISTANDDSISELIDVLKTLKVNKDNNNNNNNSIDFYQPTNDELKQLDNIVITIKNLLETTKIKERKINLVYDNVYESFDIRMLHIEKGKVDNDSNDNDDSSLLVNKFDDSAINESSDSYQCPLEHHTVTFQSALFDRAGWLMGLLAFQSCSSFILASNERLIQAHPTIIYFLTMLVGAGGNAGNQSSVRIIRGLAIGAVNDYNVRRVLIRELIMAFSISFVLGVAGFIRTLFSFQTSLPEKIAITASLILITFISIVGGAILPLFLKFLKLDPAHASTTIQVIMDISGVLITCVVSFILLDSVFGKIIMFWLGATSV
jgi:cation transporter-like permease